MLDSVPRFSIPQVGRDVALTSGLSLSAVALTFAAAVVLARTLGPSGKGEVDLSLATIYLGVMLFSLSLGNGIAFVVARGADPRRIWVMALAISIGVGAATAVVLYLIAGGPVEDAFLPAGEQSPIILMGAGAFALSLFGFTRAVLVGSGRAPRASALDVLGRGAGLALILWVVVSPALEATLEAVLAALVMGWALSAVISSILTLRMRTGSGTVPVGTLASYSAQSYLHTLVHFGNLRLGLFLVALLVGTDGVGQFAIAVSLSQLLWLPTGSAAQIIMPIVATDRRRLPLRTARATIATSITAGAALIITAPLAIPFVFGSDFAEAVGPLIILVPGAAAYGWSQLMGAYLSGIGMPRLNARAGAVGLAVGAILGVILIPTLGIAGAALASTISYAVGTAVLTRAYLRHRGRPATELIPSAEDFRALLARLGSRRPER